MTSRQSTGSESDPPELSFIIPAKNEARFVAATVAAIHAAAGERPYEVLVMDNGSTDATADLAREAGARVISVPSRTISAVRNAGVRASAGEALVFLDADVRVTPAWGRRLPAILERLRAQPRTVAGSWVSVPERGTWIERSWFGPLSRIAHAHINSGHMVVARSFFDELGGFDESLGTGEDVDLSTRAVRAGGVLFDDAELEAIHLGYPGTLRAFIRRERWHGSSDTVSLRAVMASSVALAALVFALLHAGAVVALLLGARRTAAAFAAAVVLLCLGASFHRYRASGPRFVLVNAVLFYAYFLGRVLSFLPRRQTGDGFTHRDER